MEQFWPEEKCRCVSDLYAPRKNSRSNAAEVGRVIIPLVVLNEGQVLDMMKELPW